MELYGWGVGTDLNSSQQNAVYLSSAGLGLSREYYQKETEENKKILEEYTKYISDLLGYIGESNTQEKAGKIVEFEKKTRRLEKAHTKLRGGICGKRRELRR